MDRLTDTERALAEHDARYPSPDGTSALAAYRAAHDGYPHDYGQHCCCADCTGPDGTDCVPDLYGSQCARCGRKAEHDDPDGSYIAAILDRLDAQAIGQTSWIDA